MRESSIENRFVKECKKRGAWPLKMIAAGTAGMPDRMVLMEGRVVFAELKRPGQLPRALQLKRHEQLAGYGFKVWVIDGKETIEEFIKEELTE